MTALTARAAIVSDGLWTGVDWYDNTTNIGVNNGIPYSNDPSVQRRLTAPLAYDGPVDTDYLERDNVQLVQSFFSAEQWDEAFPLADSIYTYDNFLKAVAKFPYFCSESNISDLDIGQTCAREVAALFAHWGQETGKR